MKYILILILQGVGGVTTVDRLATLSAEFDDSKACMDAAQQLTDELRRDGIRARTSCLPKGTVRPPPASEAK
jgi:hypothetical protein